MMIKKLNRNSHIPLYYQLQQILEKLVENGEFDNSQPLPTEEELMKTYEVSRTTVREALRGLLDKGVIVKKQGVGSFIAQEKITEVLPGLVSFSSEMSARGFCVRTKVLKIQEIKPSPKVARGLNLSNDVTVLRVKRLRFVDEKPIVISTSYLTCGYDPKDNFEGSIYKILEEKYGVSISYGEAIIEACLSDEYESRLLNLEKGSALLGITWRSFTEDNTPVEYSEAIFRGDSYKYVVMLKR